MSYSETLTITLPATLADIAASIARSLDPDVGGEYSFKPDVIGYTEGDKPEPIYGKTISCTTPCEALFKAQAEYMMLHHEALHAAVSADYATRWPDLPCPTLADCQAFCAACACAYSDQIDLLLLPLPTLLQSKRLPEKMND